MANQAAQKIPREWEETTLSKVAEIIGGGTPRTDVEEYWNGDIPWLSVVDFNDDNRWVEKTEKTITKEGLENSATTLLDAGDLIISARGTVGAFAQLRKQMAFNQSCYGLRAKENINSDFLFYLLKRYIPQLKKKVHGAVFDTITRDTFDHINIFLPPLPEQQAMAAVLSSFDNKIGLLREQNNTLEATAQAIFKELFQAKGGKLPKGWKMGELRDVVNIFDSKRVPLSSRERSKRKGSYPYYGATEIMDWIDDYLFDGTYLLLAEDGSVINDEGYAVLQYVTGKIWVNNHAHVLQGKGYFSTEILYLFCKKLPVTGLITGAVQPKINQENLLNFELIIPTDEILKKLNQAIQPLFKKIISNNSQVQTLSKLRDTILPKLMNGELRVKNF